MKTLREIPIGQTVMVKKLEGEGALKRRIMDMGITKGTQIYVRKVAPLGDPVEITTCVGSLTFQALPTATVQPGEVYIYHGYRELDINSILDGAALDPYSGFPAYRSACCNVRRK